MRQWFQTKIWTLLSFKNFAAAIFREEMNTWSVQVSSNKVGWMQLKFNLEKWNALHLGVRRRKMFYFIVFLEALPAVDELKR